jgi:glucose/arabinose dehydrogenase
VRYSWLTRAILITVAVCQLHSAATSQTSIAGSSRKPALVPHQVSLANGKTFSLNLPQEFSLHVAAQGLKRVRFMAKSPDGRIFVTDMYNLTDNKKGVVYILDQLDEATHTFKKVTPYLTGLRNPNSVAFHTDANGTHWLYIALTEHLVRYRFTLGEEAPTSEPEVLVKFPDYGLSYKYGGWHLTRTVTINDTGKVYVSVGSSCNACEEIEEIRATILEMDLDGKNRRTFARGLRNAVGIRIVRDSLFATNMGSDHLGIHKPADTMYRVEQETNYGWPYCFQSGPGRFPDPKFNPRSRKLNCRNVPQAYAAFDAHSSPLGLEYFDETNGSPLRDSFLVALHGSTRKSLGRGYRVVQLRRKAGATIEPEDFITGFLTAGQVHGRPADILKAGPDAFFLTDDYAGVIYYIHRK